MFVSIVIPTLNEEKYVGTLLQCLVDQTFKSFEVLVVDGGSGDKTEEVVSSFKNKLNLQFILSPKKGVAYQRNLGAEEAKANYVMFFDADDFIENDFLEKINRFISHNPDVDLLTAWVMLLSNNKFDRVLCLTYDLLYLEAVRRVRPAAPGAFMCIRKETFNDLKGFDPEVRIAEDFDFFHRAYDRGYKYELLNDPIVYTSARRMEKEGRLKYIWETGKTGVLIHLKGSIRRDGVIEYPMEGGTYYDEPRKKRRVRRKLKIKVKLPKIIEEKTNLKPVLKKLLKIGK